MDGRIVSATPQCKCGSYMVFPREKEGRKFSICKSCKKVKYEKPMLKDFFQRFMFWR